MTGHNYSRGILTTRVDNEVSVFHYLLECSWDDDLADFTYTLYKIHYFYPNIENYKTGVSVMEPVGSTHTQTLASGNREWAEKQAKHYDIPMPAEYDANITPGNTLKELGLE